MLHLYMRAQRALIMHDKCVICMLANAFVRARRSCCTLLHVYARDTWDVYALLHACLCDECYVCTHVRMTHV